LIDKEKLDAVFEMQDEIEEYLVFRKLSEMGFKTDINDIEWDKALLYISLMEEIDGRRKTNF